MLPAPTDALHAPALNFRKFAGGLLGCARRRLCWWQEGLGGRCLVALSFVRSVVCRTRHVRVRFVLSTQQGSATQEVPLKTERREQGIMGGLRRDETNVMVGINVYNLPLHIRARTHHSALASRSHSWGFGQSKCRVTDSPNAPKRINTRQRSLQTLEKVVWLCTGTDTLN